MNDVLIVPLHILSFDYVFLVKTVKQSHKSGLSIYV